MIVLARTVAAQDVAPLAEYIRGGGGLLTGARSYMLERTFPGVDLANRLPVSRLTALAGVAWAHSEVLPASTRGFRVEPPAELSHAGKALAAFEESEAHKRFLGEKEQAQMYAALSHAALDLQHDTRLLPRLDRALARFEAGAIPSAAMPIARDDIPWRLAIARATERSRGAPPDDMRAHPAAAEFPGAVPSTAPRITATIRLETYKGRMGLVWHRPLCRTGRSDYRARAASGHRSRAGGSKSGCIGPAMGPRRVEPDAGDRDVKHIRSTEVRAASAFGRGIYIDVPKDSGAGDFDVTIYGGVPAPRYIDGKTGLSEWRSSIRDLPAPWGEIESDKIVLSVPSRLVRDLDDPAALMRIWDDVRSHMRVSRDTKWRQRPERLSQMCRFRRAWTTRAIPS